MDDQEKWLPVKESQGYYLVSTLGRVRNSSTGKIIKPYIGKDGYKRVSLSGLINTPTGYKKLGTKKVSRLVVDAFKGASGKGMWKHINGVRSDDRAENLEEM